MPITINEAMQHINNNEYLLPAFQREFVWKCDQIEKLFDSLMRGYPTSSMLFWKVKGETKTKWKFYKFISSFVLDSNNFSISNELFNTSNSNDFYAVLDGQQRLTAMRIGIYGTYSYHESRKSWDYSKMSFPPRSMYLNISKTGGMDDDCKYFFNFKKDTDTNLKTFYLDTNNELWFKVSEIVPFHNSGDEIADYFEDVELVKEQRQIIKKLENTIFNDLSITYYEEDEQNPDKAVKIFTRINSGGTFLSFSDIVFSLMVANWDNKDARNEISELIKSVGQKGFEIDKAYIVKALLYLYHRSVKTEINSFSKDFCDIIESHLDEIRNCILSMFDLFRSFGLTSFTLTSNNATLPVLYYLYHSGNYNDYTNRVQFKDERAEIKKWLFSAILRKVFGATSDSVLTQTRKAFTDDISDKFIDENYVFSSNLIYFNIKNIGTVDDEIIENLLGVQKDNCYAFPILSLLYPHLDYKNNDFHKDHLHVDDLYNTLSEDIKSKHLYKEYNSIVNLQMLDKNENESKGKKSLKDWVDESCLDTDTKERFFVAHLIPDVNLSLSNIDEFLNERKKLLIKKLLNKLKHEKEGTLFYNQYKYKRLLKVVFYYDFAERRKRRINKFVCGKVYIFSNI